MRPRLSEGPSDVLLGYVMNERLAEEGRGVQLLSEITIAHVVMAGPEYFARAATRVLVNALLEVAESGFDAFGDLDPSEGFYLAYDQRLIEDLGLDIGGVLHTARSRNDLGATLHRLKTRVQIIKIMDGLLALRGTLLDSSGGALDMVKTGYTHHQPVQPVMFGHWLLAIEGALGRAWLCFEQALTRTNEMPLGNCALAKGHFSSTTLLANHLVRQTGLSFWEAHDLVARLVRAAQARGVDCTSIDAGLLNDTAGYDVGITDQRLREILDPNVNGKRLEHSGGPAPTRNVSVVTDRRKRLRSETKKLGCWKQHFINARADLFEADRKLAGV